MNNNNNNNGPPPQMPPRTDQNFANPYAAPPVQYGQQQQQPQGQYPGMQPPPQQQQGQGQYPGLQPAPTGMYLDPGASAPGQGAPGGAPPTYQNLYPPAPNYNTQAGPNAPPPAYPGLAPPAYNPNAKVEPIPGPGVTVVVQQQHVVVGDPGQIPGTVTCNFVRSSSFGALQPLHLTVNGRRTPGLMAYESCRIYNIPAGRIVIRATHGSAGDCVVDAAPNQVLYFDCYTQMQGLGAAHHIKPKDEGWFFSQCKGNRSGKDWNSLGGKESESSKAAKKAEKKAKHDAKKAAKHSKGK